MLHLRALQRLEPGQTVADGIQLIGVAFMLMSGSANPDAPSQYRPAGLFVLAVTYRARVVGRPVLLKRALPSHRLRGRSCKYRTDRNCQHGVEKADKQPLKPDKN